MMTNDINRELVVKLTDRSYPITIGSGLFAQFAPFNLQAGQRVFIVTNCTVAPLYLKQIRQMLTQNGIQTDYTILPDGEKYKNLATWQTIFTALLEKNYTRKSIIMALGGGVIGDMAGFAAACYQRGIKFVQVPTTLLSQVDSSVGGKTGINHPMGKNMIGAFYQPQAVVIDINSLNTLPQRQLSAGLAEVIKYGIILDSQFFTWLEKNMDQLLALEPQAMTYCIYRCCELKAQIVVADEHEQNVRALLNLGHTFGHAIETELGYGNWLHGEAVSVGILMASQTAYLLGMTTAEEVIRIKHLLGKAQLPVARPQQIAIENYLSHMLRDKKVLSNKLRLVLPRGIGQAEIKDDVPEHLVLEAISSI